MTVTAQPPYRHMASPLKAVLLGATLALFLGALFSDIAYFRSYQIQWSNFASWLIAGGLVCGGLALLFALLDLFRVPNRTGRPLLSLLLLLGAWLLGLINAFEHAKDAWAVMPAGLVLSVIVLLLVFASAWLGLAGARAGGVQ